MMPIRKECNYLFSISEAPTATVTSTWVLSYGAHVPLYKMRLIRLGAVSIIWLLMSSFLSSNLYQVSYLVRSPCLLGRDSVLLQQGKAKAFILSKEKSLSYTFEHFFFSFCLAGVFFLCLALFWCHEHQKYYYIYKISHLIWIFFPNASYCSIKFLKSNLSCTLWG